ncbi:MAG: TonB-dependent receptor plug domain-containing protein [Verrucomicrobiota bacterium]
MKISHLLTYSGISLLIALHGALAQEPPETNEFDVAGADVLDTTVITGKAEDLIGEALTATQGQSSAEELEARPFVRRGELLEVVPGMTITQHSGGGKANQYFLRGFNLDHGTDFGVFVDGMPVNARTHGHGQGYADINFLIPELVEELDYYKGPFYAELGDFTTAGAARFRLRRTMPEGLARFTIGEDNYYRMLIADTFEAGKGSFTFATEYNAYDGPWVTPDNLQRWNWFARYSVGDDFDYTNVTFMGYDSTWDATDQVPQRAVDSGLIDRLGFIDPTVGGESSRYSLSLDHRKETKNGVTNVSAYVGKYKLNLFSNFTLFLNDPVNGDQFQQFDDRWFAGATVTQQLPEFTFLGREADLLLGAQTHHDFIDGVALRNTSSRKVISTVCEDDVYEMSMSGFGQMEVRWNDWIRTQTGVRGDLYYFDVDSNNRLNSGSEWDGIVSPKAGLVLGPWNDTELYLNGGLGFHSNDARGATITVDPVTGDSADPVDPLVRTYGAETGVRTQLIPNLTSTLAFWYLESDSELVYVGDAGNIEAGDASERYGVELANYWRPNDWLTVDTEFTFTESRFVPSGEEIDNSIPYTFSSGITVGRDEGVFASLRTRYFSPRPLNGDGSIESKDAFQVNARVGYRKDNWEIALEALNLLDADDNDIEYFYASRLRGEPLGGFEDRHFHPFEPRQFRLSFTYRW